MKTSIAWTALAGVLLIAPGLTGCGEAGPPGERDPWSADVPEAVPLTGDETWAQRPAEQAPEPVVVEDETEEEAADETETTPEAPVIEITPQPQPATPAPEIPAAPPAITPVPTEAPPTEG